MPLKGFSSPWSRSQTINPPKNHSQPAASPVSIDRAKKVQVVQTSIAKITEGLTSLKLKPAGWKVSQIDKRQIPNELLNLVLAYIDGKDFNGKWLTVSKAFYHTVGTQIYRQITLGFDCRETDDFTVNPLLVKRTDYKGTKIFHRNLDWNLMPYLRVLAVHPNAISLHALDILREFKGHERYGIRYGAVALYDPRNLTFETLRYYPTNISHKHKGIKFGTLAELGTQRLIYNTLVLRDLTPSWAIPKPGFTHLIRPSVNKIVLVINKKKPSTQRLYPETLSIGGQRISYNWFVPDLPSSITDLVVIFETSSAHEDFTWPYSYPPNPHSSSLFLASFAVAFCKAKYRITIVNVQSFEGRYGAPNVGDSRHNFQTVFQLYHLHALKKTDKEYTKRLTDIRFLSMGEYLQEEDWEGVFDEDEVRGWLPF